MSIHTNNNELEISRDELKTLKTSSMLMSAKFDEKIDAIEKQLDAGTNYGCDNSFFVADLGVVYRQYKKWMKHLPQVEPKYAMKANNSPKVLEMMIKLGLGFDCASMGEMQTIMEMGGGPAKIVYANTYKQASMLQYSQSIGVDLMSVDSADELRSCRKWFPNARILARFECDDEGADHPLSSKFGATMEEIYNILDLGKEIGSNIVGIAFHVGSGSLKFDLAIQTSRKLFDYAKDKLGYEFSTLDLGGGFVDKSFEKVASLTTNALEENGFGKDSGIHVFAEPGRFFVTQAFTLATKVIGRRFDKSEGMLFINDGVMGNLDCVTLDYNRPIPGILRTTNAATGTAENHFRSLSLDYRNPTLRMSVWGPTCDDVDFIRDLVPMPITPNLEDWLYFDKMGAYTLCGASTFNGFSNATEVLWVCSDSEVEQFMTC